MTTATKTARPRPHECSERHFPGTLCRTCEGTPPRHGLADLPDLPYEQRWSTWYRTFTVAEDPKTATTPEHRAEIFAATDQYNAAKDAVDRASIELVKAHRAERKARYTGAWDASGPVSDAPEVITRTRKEKNDAAIALDNAEKALGDSLRHLNLVSIPPAQRRQQQLSVIEQVKRLIFA